MNSNYRPPNYNTLRRDIQGALASLTFSDGVSIDVGPFTAQDQRPALRVIFRGEIYKPNYNSRLGPLKEIPYYDIILETKALEQKSSDAARPEDIRQIENVLFRDIPFRDIPRGKQNSITSNNIQEGNYMITWGQNLLLDDPRYYKRSTFERLPGKLDPFTRQAIQNETRYKAHLVGGRHKKTRKSKARGKTSRRMRRFPK
jgi:hypothetical protein